jgi:hypothetical protein
MGYSFFSLAASFEPFIHDAAAICYAPFGALFRPDPFQGHSTVSFPRFFIAATHALMFHSFIHVYFLTFELFVLTPPPG